MYRGCDAEEIQSMDNNFKNKDTGDQNIAQGEGATGKKEQVILQDVQGNGHIIAGNGPISVVNHNWYCLHSADVPPRQFQSKETPIGIHINKVGQKYIIKWHFGTLLGQFTPLGMSYPLNIKELKKRSKRLADSLANYLENTQDYLLVDVAKQGFKFLELLFVTKDNHRYMTVQECRNIFFDNREKITAISICLNVDTDFIFDIPWSCVYMPLASDSFNYSSDLFWGNKYNIYAYVSGATKDYDKTYIDPQSFRRDLSSYAAQKSENLTEIRNFLIKNFNKTLYLNCETIENNDEEAKGCKDLKDFCSEIMEQKAEVLFLSFTRKHNNKLLYKIFKKNSVHVGEINIDNFGEQLQKIKKASPLIIVTGEGLNHDDRIKIKKLFFSDLHWAGIIMDGNVHLSSASTFLSSCLEAIMKGNSCIPKALWETRKRYPKKNIGLAFTAYWAEISI